MKSGSSPAAARSISPFPLLYASSFSGFYLPLMMVLWLLMLRGIAIEFRNHIDSPVWRRFWDVVFCVSSALLGHLLRRGAGQRRPRRAARRDRLFLRAALDQFPPRAATRHPRLVHHPHRRHRLLALTLHGSLWVQFNHGDVCERSSCLAA